MAKLVKQTVDMGPMLGKFTIYSDLEGFLEPAAINWSVRTKEFTAQSFADYVNGKGTHKVMTEEEYNKKFPKKS